MYYADGSTWTGEWKNGKANRPGTMYSADGSDSLSGNSEDNENEDSD